MVWILSLKHNKMLLGKALRKSALFSCKWRYYHDACYTSESNSQSSPLTRKKSMVKICHGHFWSSIVTAQSTNFQISKKKWSNRSEGWTFLPIELTQYFFSPYATSICQTVRFTGVSCVSGYVLLLTSRCPAPPPFHTLKPSATWRSPLFPSVSQSPSSPGAKSTPPSSLSVPTSLNPLLSPHPPFLPPPLRPPHTPPACRALLPRPQTRHASRPCWSLLTWPFTACTYVCVHLRARVCFYTPCARVCAL